MEDNNLGTDLEAFLSTANLTQLIPTFKAEEIDLQDLLSLPNDELRNVVDNPESYEALLAAKENLTKNAELNFLGEASGLCEAKDGPERVKIDSICALLTLNGLNDYFPAFIDEEMDLEDFLDLPEAELQKFVPKIGHWNKLCRARRQYSLQMKEDPNKGEFVPFQQVSTQSLEDFLDSSGLDTSVYLPRLQDDGIGMEELLDLPDDLLKKTIPKIGPWNKLCKAKRAFLENSRCDEPGRNTLSAKPMGKLEEFLKELGLEQYVDTFRAQEMEYEDVLKISEGNLRKVIPKMGPANKILEARRSKIKNKNGITGNGDGKFVDDDYPIDAIDDEKVLEPKINDKNTLNILLLGETGVGKSTFINAFANYLTFETLEEAMNGKILALIASSFAVTDEQFKHHKVSIGQDINENNSSGQSATQACKSYLFPFDNCSIRLIDTPGIGDTRGIEQDKLNLDNILAFIGKHEDLHGICILLKPNNARLTVSFSFCIKELLCHLQKDAARNIMFVFTNSRSTFYKPGDTAPTLKAILDEIEKSPPHVRIPFEKETVYCYDNESFRFLMAHNEGIRFQGNQSRIFSDSWKISVKECKRMIGRIAELTPHKVQDTVSINEARRLIIELSKPIADIAQNINVNLQVIQDKRNELLLTDEDMQGLEKKLKVPVIDLEQRPFTKPRTVCTSPECIEVRTIGSITKTNYRQKCHDPCYLTGVQAELIDNPALLQCSAMAGRNNCSVCSCSYKMHMHIYYECVEIETHIEDSTVQDLIRQKADGKALIAQSIRTLEERSQDLENEKDLLTKCTARFAVFLKSNAIAPYNDSFQDYLEHLISNERTKNVTAGASNLLVIEGLEKMLGAYKEEKRILDEVMVNVDLGGGGTTGAAVLTPDDIKALEQSLYAMKINGPRLKQFREGYRVARQQEHSSYSETVHKPPRRPGKNGQKKTHWVNGVWNGVKRVGSMLFY